VPSESAQVAILLGGLLPQFKPKALILNDHDNLTMTKCKKDLVSFARSEGLLQLRKSGSTSQGNRSKIFMVHDDPLNSHPRLCFDWSNNRCAWGEDCKFDHSGPGGFAEAGEAQERRDAIKKGRKKVAKHNKQQQHATTPPAPIIKKTRFEPLPDVESNYCQTKGQHATTKCPAVQECDIKYSYIAAMGEDDKQQQCDVDSSGPDGTMLIKVLVLLFSAIGSILLAPVRILQYFFSNNGTNLLGFLLVLVLVWVNINVPTAAAVSSHAYYNNNNDHLPEAFNGWVCDTGTNCFTTNALQMRRLRVYTWQDRRWSGRRGLRLRKLKG
jgi:hypothetical protein